MLRTLSARIVTAQGRNNYQLIRCISGKIPAPTPPNQLTESMLPFRSNSVDEGFVWKSRYGEIMPQNTTVDQYVWRNLDKWHNKIAIVCGITGRSYSYGKLRDHCAALAYRLRNDFNLKSGDVVAISMPNVPEYAMAVLGVLEAGLTVTTINPAYSAGSFNCFELISYVVQQIYIFSRTSQAMCYDRYKSDNQSSG